MNCPPLFFSLPISLVFKTQHHHNYEILQKNFHTLLSMRYVLISKKRRREEGRKKWNVRRSSLLPISLVFKTHNTTQNFEKNFHTYIIIIYEICTHFEKEKKEEEEMKKYEKREFLNFLQCFFWSGAVIIIIYLLLLLT